MFQHRFFVAFAKIGTDETDLTKTREKTPKNILKMQNKKRGMKISIIKLLHVPESHHSRIYGRHVLASVPCRLKSRKTSHEKNAIKLLIICNKGSAK